MSFHEGLEISRSRNHLIANFNCRKYHSDIVKYQFESVPGNARLVVAKYNLSLKASRSLALFASSMRSSVWEDM